MKNAASMFAIHRDLLDKCRAANASPIYLGMLSIRVRFYAAALIAGENYVWG